MPRSASCSATSPTSSTSCPLPRPGPWAWPWRCVTGTRHRRSRSVPRRSRCSPGGPRTRRSSCCSTTPTCSTSRRRGRWPSRRGGWAPTRCSSWPPSASGEGGPLAEAGLPELAVTGLDAAGVGSLMATLGLPATAEAAARARTVTAGNPLAVTELVRRPDALARLALDDPIPLSGRLVEVFAERAGELGADVQLVVALTALAGGSATLVVEAARALGVDDGALGRAEAAALVDLDGDHVAPRHPLVGSAVYSSLSAEQRRRLHAAVAEALPAGSHRRACPAPRRRRGRSRRGAGCRARAGRGGRRRPRRPGRGRGRARARRRHHAGCRSAHRPAPRGRRGGLGGR